MNPHSASIYAIATCDTKAAELAFLARAIDRAGGRVVTADVGTLGPCPVPVDIPRERILAVGGGGDVAALDRGAAVAAMAEALGTFLEREHAAGRVGAVIGLGGSGGTALLAAAFRRLPLGVPKLIVSTVASGLTAPYVDVSDLVLIPSVVDVAGLNAVSRRILTNAAAAVAGMAAHGAATMLPADPRPAVGMTMFGVTTPCVTAVREALEAGGHECLVFHATGTGGRAMEGLVRAGILTAVLDLTTTEVADEIVGGVFGAGPDRFRATAAAGIPCVLSVGAMDMVNFGGLDTVPAGFRDRRLHVHNPQVTLMRTTPEECVRCARYLAERLADATGPLEILLPTGGVSALAVPGGPFHDPAADEALFAELERLLPDTPRRRVRRVAAAINDPAFSAAVLAAFARVRSAAPAPDPRQDPARR
jgi:uncharacterized protein (UPF0261 family)